MTKDEGEEPLVHNWTAEMEHGLQFPERIVFWDETLRDGEQTPGVYFTLEEKVELAKLLDEAGVDILNCGFPAVSKGELRSVKAIAAEELENASVMAAARPSRRDIDEVLVADAEEICPFIPASRLHLKYKMKMTHEEIIDRAVEAIEYAGDHGLPVTFVTVDSSRADLNFLERLYNASIDAGAVRVLFCDTVGVLTPPATRWFLGEMEERISKDAEFGFHNHNDFGLGTANALTALGMGIPCINTTVNGIGERAGNVPFEEVVMALELLYNHPTHIRKDKLTELSRRVEKASGIPLSPTKPVVGSNAFTHESGIHTHGVLANVLTYEPMQPEMIGHRRRFVYGKHTGSTAVKDRLERAGIKASEDELREITDQIKKLTEGRGKEEFRAFIDRNREWNREHTGANKGEFWQIVEEVTGEKSKSTEDFE